VVDHWTIERVKISPFEKEAGQYNRFLLLPKFLSYAPVWKLLQVAPPFDLIPGSKLGVGASQK
jgi:hypothetical protein